MVIETTRVNKPKILKEAPTISTLTKFAKRLKKKLKRVYGKKLQDLKEYVIHHYLPYVEMEKMVDQNEMISFQIEVRKKYAGKNSSRPLTLLFRNRSKEVVYTQTGSVIETRQDSIVYLFEIKKSDIYFEESRRSYDLFVEIGKKLFNVRLDEEFGETTSRPYFENDHFVFQLRYDRHRRAFFKVGYKHDIATIFDIPNMVKQIDFDGQELIVQGKIHHEFFVKEYPEARFFFVLKKKNGSYLKAPMQIANEDFAAALNIEDYSFFPKGKWDAFIMADYDYHEYFYPCYVRESNESAYKKIFQLPWYREAIRYKSYAINGKLHARTSYMAITTSHVQYNFSETALELNLDFEKEQFQNYIPEDITEVSLRIRQRDANSYLTVPFTYNVENDKMKLEAMIDYEAFGFDTNERATRWDLYISYHKDGFYYNYRLKINNATEMPVLEKHTFFNEDDYYYCSLYTTKYKRLSFVYARQPFKKYIDSYQVKDGQLFMQGMTHFETNENTDSFQYSLSMVLENRATEEVLEFSVTEGAMNEKGEKPFHFSIPFEEMSPLVTQFKDILDFYIVMKGGPVTRKLKLGLKQYDYFKDDVLATFNKEEADHVIEYHITTTPKGNLKLESFMYEKDLYAEIQEFAEKETNEDIWLVGERPDTAQDNGYQFFKYMREHFPEKEIYYVIEKGALDSERLNDPEHVLYIGSREHIQKSLRASRLIGTHDLDYILPFKGIKIKNYRNAQKVFLQHGVLGRKNVEYHKKYYRYPFDLFIVSSGHEKRMVKRKLGYTNEDVIVTGLSRFDRLQENHQPKREILLIPTWREWIINEDRLMESLYFEKYMKFLQSDELKQILEENDLKLNFYPHYRMQQYIIENVSFDNPRIHLIELGTKMVQDLLKENSLMITDYSSVSFDFTLLGKPVIYYHFDQDVFFANGILRPIEETFLGDIVYTQQDLLMKLEEVVKENFRERSDVVSRKKLIFSYQDMENNRRILSHILNEPLEEDENDDPDHITMTDLNTADQEEETDQPDTEKDDEKVLASKS
ncbi:CDP-glycerol glycerophosphotransferase family protein [Peribacillus psychrosaccharolyticus]|uniref:CDP-glycerol glycerophosphotransferase family protein n=1 Tax=Peribacillus psychrosaccharolyticus TaxID=1407 RepID=A0A974RZ76_PERPY|nr:CDP-glycerol glycerophosphotransferase family protein [Peribacillus psychrosaccharolyticus]MEC2055460.1 CDP-glycerol glycerophosphotransferase family protein [Peribacillus psychrosaccharolyticus]MED3743510.1 CDP-glycerol glycerophosphotransferase family protein [Peribacillus psychrosaccharolyticus]QQS99140.1 CDP-glycerol glycerophosphotransferase family protein [Peribacillus psychrosaccharolyticus]